tara:strand:+ start:422 stop:619 length:198 start_codon:yes stop_codon:yes gene_type:complete
MGVNSYIWPLYKTEDFVPPTQIKKDKYNQSTIYQKAATPQKPKIAAVGLKRLKSIAKKQKKPWRL